MTTPIPSWETNWKDSAAGLVDSSKNYRNVTLEDVRTEIEAAKKEERDEIVKIARKYQEQIQGGGNGRRIVEQMIKAITSRNQND